MKRLPSAVRLIFSWLRLFLGALPGFLLVVVLGLLSRGDWAIPAALLGGLWAGIPQRRLMRPVAASQVPWAIVSALGWGLVAAGATLGVRTLYPAFTDLDGYGPLFMLATPGLALGALLAAAFETRFLRPPQGRRGAAFAWLFVSFLALGLVALVLMRSGRPWLAGTLGAAVYSLLLALGLSGEESGSTTGPT